MPTTDYAVVFDKTVHNHINHGYFWPRNIGHGECWWEAWVSPDNGAEYWVSDGYGGAHNLLFGVTLFDSGYGKLSGNMCLNGSSNVNFSSIDNIYANDWHHVAVGYDGSYIRTYLDGVFQEKVAFAGARQTSGSVAEGILYIGGSGHSNWNGMVRMVRGIEGHCPITTEASFYPEANFKNAFDDDANGVFGCQFLADYTVPANIIADLSDGYLGIRHPGRGGAFDEEVGRFGDAYSSYSNVNLPTFATANFAAPSIYRGSTTSTPVGAVVFDAFERVDVTPAWHDTPTLGTAPTGQTWSGTGLGIIDGKAYTAFSNSTINWIDMGTADQDVRVTRTGSTDYPYAIARYTDDNNHLRAYGDASSMYVFEFIAGVATLKANVAYSGWTTIRMTTSGSTVNLYADSEGSPRATFTTSLLTGNKAAFYIDINQGAGQRVASVEIR